MLRQLVLSHFKAFGSKQEIPLSPITLIFGANSAGKSSVLQSLLLLKQSMDNTETPEQFVLPKGDLVDLGSAREMAYLHKTDRSIQISLVADNKSLANKAPNPFSAQQPIVEPALGGIGVEFHAAERTRTAKPQALPVYLGDASAPAYRILIGPQLSPASAKRIRFATNASAIGTAGVAYEVSFEINHNHSIWHTWWIAFQTETIPKYKHRLTTLLSALEPLQLPHHETAPNNTNSKRQRQSISPSVDTLLDYFWRNLESIPPTQLTPSLFGAPTELSALKQILASWKHRLDNYTYDNFIEDILPPDNIGQASLRNCLLDDIRLNAPSDADIRRMWRMSSSWLDDEREMALPDLALFARIVSREQRERINDLVYLGPLRQYPERQYIVGGRSTNTVGKAGAFAPDILFGSRSLQKSTNEILEEFGLGYRLEIRELVNKDELDAGADVFSVRLIDKDNNANVSLVDVGFGISQVLPIIVQSMLSKRSTILVEQPEIHLHPRLQAELGTLFSKCIRSPMENQFLIETHSEHLILRLQRLIRRGVLSAADVTVLYVGKVTGDHPLGSYVEHLPLDERGRFKRPWPDGFFDDSFDEMFGR